MPYFYVLAPNDSLLQGTIFMESAPSEDGPAELAVQQQLVEWGIRDEKAHTYAQTLILVCSRVTVCVLTVFQNGYFVDDLHLLTKEDMKDMGFTLRDNALVLSRIKGTSHPVAPSLYIVSHTCTFPASFWALSQHPNPLSHGHCLDSITRTPH